ncbi:hypothetical protein NPIL_695011, partial [Nephila pilipes]
TKFSIFISSISKCVFKLRKPSEIFLSTSGHYTYILMFVLESVQEFIFNGDFKSKILVRYKCVPTTTIILYVLFSKLLGPHLMKNKNPFQLKRLLVVYNFTMSVLSAYLTYHDGSNIFLI